MELRRWVLSCLVKIAQKLICIHQRRFSCLTLGLVELVHVHKRAYDGRYQSLPHKRIAQRKDNIGCVLERHRTASSILSMTTLLGPSTAPHARARKSVMPFWSFNAEQMASPLSFPVSLLAVLAAAVGAFSRVGTPSGAHLAPLAWTAAFSSFYKP